MNVFFSVSFFLFSLLLSAQSDTIFIKHNLNKGNGAPEYVIDTIADAGGFSAKPVLIGTTILPWTGNQQAVKGYNLLFDSIVFTECTNGGEPQMTYLTIIDFDSGEVMNEISDSNRVNDNVESEDSLSLQNWMESQYGILSASQTDSTVTINIQVFENCSRYFLCDVQVVDDSILNLVYHSYGNTYSSCDCCYGLSYHFTHLFKGKGDFLKLKWVMMNGYLKTKKSFAELLNQK